MTQTTEKPKEFEGKMNAFLKVISFSVVVFIGSGGRAALAEEGGVEAGKPASDAGAEPIAEDVGPPAGAPEAEPEDDFAVEQPTEEGSAPPNYEKAPPAREGDPVLVPAPAPAPAPAPSAEPAPSAQPAGPITIQTFHSALSPYGTWYETTEFGWVWRPRVWAGWRPYTYGRWLYTSHGWTWRSYHRWGWAPFHYGRWFVHPDLGWSWVPGTQWAPAWVAWRHSDGHVGWAPVPPGYRHYTSTVVLPVVHESHWVFVPGAHMTSVRVYRHVIHHRHTHFAGVFRATTYSPVYVRVGRVAHAGPRPVVVAHAIGRVVKPIPVVAATRAGLATTHRGSIAIYRPRVHANTEHRRPVVGVRGVDFGGGKRGAVVTAVQVPKHLVVPATRLSTTWRPVVAAPAKAIRAMLPAVKTVRTAVRNAPPARRDSAHAAPANPKPLTGPGLMRPPRGWRPPSSASSGLKPPKQPINVPSSKPAKKGRR